MEIDTEENLSQDEVDLMNEKYEKAVKFSMVVFQDVIQKLEDGGIEPQISLQAFFDTNARYLTNIGMDLKDLKLAVEHSWKDQKRIIQEETSEGQQVH